MIKITLNNQLLNSLIKIEQNKTILENTKVPVELSNKFRKNTRKRSSYASNAIEGNPLSYEQAERAIESKNRHFLKPEQEVRNYYLALELLSTELEIKTPFSIDLLLKVQKQIVSGEDKESGIVHIIISQGVWNEYNLKLLNKNKTDFEEIK